MSKENKGNKEKQERKVVHLEIGGERIPSPQKTVFSASDSLANYCCSARNRAREYHGAA